MIDERYLFLYYIKENISFLCGIKEIIKNILLRIIYICLLIWIKSKVISVKCIFLLFY